MSTHIGVLTLIWFIFFKVQYFDGALAHDSSTSRGRELYHFAFGFSSRVKEATVNSINIYSQFYQHFYSQFTYLSNLLSPITIHVVIHCYPRSIGAKIQVCDMRYATTLKDGDDITHNRMDMRKGVMNTTGCHAADSCKADVDMERVFMRCVLSTVDTVRCRQIQWRTIDKNEMIKILMSLLDCAIPRPIIYDIESAARPSKLCDAEFMIEFSTYPRWDESTLRTRTHASYSI